MWDPQAEQFVAIDERQAQVTKNPVFRVGEEVMLKGLTFVIVDIAPAQLKLKPKRH
jgi:hypothetical protein